LEASIVAEQVPAVSDVLTAIERRDWPRLKRLLDPEVHWTTAIEEHLHGRDEVIASSRRSPAGSTGIPRGARRTDRALDRHPWLG
jgi:hypothetical protein